MHLEPSTLDGIVQGRVTLAFRKWIRPTVHAGDALRTRAGTIHVISVMRIDPDQVTAEDARSAGFASSQELFTALAAGRPGWLHRIELRP